MPKIVDKDLMRQTIILVSMQAFVKHGFHNTTMSKIAAEMCIAKGTLYLYFKSKEQLIEAISTQHFKNIKHKLTTQSDFKTTEDLLCHIQEMLLVSDEESKFIPVFFEVFGPSFSSNDFVEKYSSFFNEIGSFYQSNLEMLKSKGLAHEDLSPNFLGRVLVSMLDGIILHKGLFNINDNNYNDMVKEVIKFLGRGIKP